MNDATRLENGFPGLARREEGTVEKVPHPRLMVQSGPGVLFAYLSISTTTTTGQSDIVTTATLATRTLQRIFFPSEVAGEGGFPDLPSPSCRAGLLVLFGAGVVVEKGS